MVSYLWKNYLFLCSLGRLTVFIFQKSPTRGHRELTLDSTVIVNYTHLVQMNIYCFVLFIIPAMTISLNIEVNRIAYFMAKALNITSQAIHAMG